MNELPNFFLFSEDSVFNNFIFLIYYSPSGILKNWIKLKKTCELNQLIGWLGGSLALFFGKLIENLVDFTGVLVYLARI